MAQDDKGKAPAEKPTTQVDGAKEPHEKTDKDGKKPVDLPAGAHPQGLAFSALTLTLTLQTS